MSSARVKKNPAPQETKSEPEPEPEPVSETVGIVAPPLRRMRGKGRQKEIFTLFREHLEMLSPDQREAALLSLRETYFEPVTSDAEEILSARQSLKHVLRDSIGVISIGFESVRENCTLLAGSINELLEALKRHQTACG